MKKQGKKYNNNLADLYDTIRNYNFYSIDFMTRTLEPALYISMRQRPALLYSFDSKYVPLYDFNLKDLIEIPNFTNKYLEAKKEFLNLGLENQTISNKKYKTYLIKKYKKAMQKMRKWEFKAPKEIQLLLELCD